MLDAQLARDKESSRLELDHHPGQTLNKTRKAAGQAGAQEGRGGETRASDPTQGGKWK